MPKRKRIIWQAGVAVSALILSVVVVVAYVGNAPGVASVCEHIFAFAPETSRAGDWGRCLSVYDRRRVRVGQLRFARTARCIVNATTVDRAARCP